MSEPTLKIVIEDQGFPYTYVNVLLDGTSIGGGGIGGEPEDATIGRDYSWIVPALKAVAESFGHPVEVEHVDEHA